MITPKPTLDRAERLFETRNRLRLQGDYRRSDRIRDALVRVGYIVKDGDEPELLCPADVRFPPGIDQLAFEKWVDDIDVLKEVQEKPDTTVEGLWDLFKETAGDAMIYIMAGLQYAKESE
jgi:hypothetical protein